MKGNLLHVGSLVAVLALGCGGGGGGGGGGAILAVGGTGLAGDGGVGGVVQVVTVSGGDLVVGDAEAVPLEAPDIPAPDLGVNPLTISGEVTLDPTASLLGDDGETGATGLWVTGGSRLRVDTSVTTGVSLFFAAGIRIDGTLELHPGLAGLPDGALNLSTKGIALVTGTIDTSGLEGGGNAASVSVHAEQGILFRGKLLAAGAEGEVGGMGGPITLQSTGPIVCSASIDTSGGNGLTGAGGSAGNVTLQADPEDTARLSETVRAVGGDGAAGGGRGGMLSLLGGTVYSSAQLAAAGGSATADGPGGPGGGIMANAAAGRVVVTGDVAAPGGGGAGFGVGGPGGLVTVGAIGSGPGALTFLSGNIDVSGGAGAAGGQGGSALVIGQLSTPSTAPHEGPAVAMPGFATLDVSGGAGSDAGGRSGAMILVNASVTIEEQSHVGASFVEAELRAVGGAGGTGNGGPGGTVLFQGMDLVCRDLLADGGASTEATGGEGGMVQVIAPRGKVTYGSASAMGGVGAVAQGPAGVVYFQTSELYVMASSSER